MPPRMLTITPKNPLMLFGLPWRVIDSANKMSRPGGALLVGTNTMNSSDPRLEDIERRVRTPGRTIQLIITPSTTNNFIAIGWGAAQSDAVPDDQGILLYGNALYAYDAGLQLGGIEALTNGSAYTVWLVQRNTGALLIVQGGSQFASPTLVWVGGKDLSDTTPLKAIIGGNYLGTGTTLIRDAGAPVQTDYGGAWSLHTAGAESVAYSPALNATATMVANGAVAVVWRAANETLDIAVRRTDDDNCWIVRFVQSTSTLSIIEKNASIETSRATNTTANGSVSVGEWCRVFIRCNGNRIDCAITDMSGQQSRFLTYASASFNNTATGVKLMSGTTFYTLETFPIAITPAAALGTPPLNILAVGDSKTGGSNDTTVVPGVAKNGFVYWLWRNLETARSIGAYERPARVAHAGFTIAQLAAAMPADILAASGTPDAILLNAGVNDLASLPLEATCKANYAAILDALHVAYPAAPIYVTKPWGIGMTTNADTLAGWIDTVLATRSWATVGADERTILEGGDNGATYMNDTLHPNTAGHQALAAAYQAAMGY